MLLVSARSEPEQPDTGRLLGIPLGVLVLAQELLEEGFEVRVIDQSVQPNLAELMSAMPRPAYVGISCNGGEQIIGGQEIAVLVSKLWPGVPRVWGGWGPTLTPELYEHSSSAIWTDIFVRGRGSVAIKRLSHALVGHRSLDGIDGLTWRDDGGGIHRNPDSPRDIPSTRAPMPYHLVEWDLYMTRMGILNYISAYGCPHRCAFCSIPAGAPTFDPLDNTNVIEHLRIAKSLGVTAIVFSDDNFFTSKKRVLDLARRMIDSGLELEWHSNGRVDQLSRMSSEDFRLLRDSGCTYFNIGLETGDQETSDSVSKDIVVEDMFEVARRCREADIGLTINCIMGLPGETAAAQVRSFTVLEQIYAIQPKMFVYWHLYLPMPGTTLWRKHVEEGVLDEPRTLDEMIALGRYVAEEAGYYQRPRKRVFRLNQDLNQAIGWYFFMGYVAPRASWYQEPVMRWVRRWCRLRYDRRWFRCLIDWRTFYWPHYIRRHILWKRRKATRRWPALQRVLFPRDPGYRCHYALLFSPEHGLANRRNGVPPRVVEVAESRSA